MCVAPCGDGCPFIVGMLREEVRVRLLPSLACAAAHWRMFQLISSAHASCAAGARRHPRSRRIVFRNVVRLRRRTCAARSP